MKLCLLLLVLLITACSQTPTVPERITVPVDRPVYCAALPVKPDYVTATMSKDMSAEQKVALILMERQQRISRENELESIIIGCQKPR